MSQMIQERHGFAGALQVVGGMGGHLGVPHVQT